MSKITNIIVIYLLLAAAVAFAAGENPCHGPQQFAKFHVYVKDVFGTGSNATMWMVARNHRTDESRTFFGEMRVVDNLMPAGAEFNWAVLGRMQGMVVFSDLKDTSVTVNMNFYFTEGRFKGSSLICLGRNPVSDLRSRDFPIIGGTGTFLNARGYTVSETAFANNENTYHITKYYIYVVYEVVLPNSQKMMEDLPLTEVM